MFKIFAISQVSSILLLSYMTTYVSEYQVCFPSWYISYKNMDSVKNISDKIHIFITENQLNYPLSLTKIIHLSYKEAATVQEGLDTS